MSNIKEGLHSAVWAARLEIARGLRRLANKIHEDDGYRMPGLNMVMVRRKGLQVIRVPLGPKAIGAPLFYQASDYDKAWTPEGDYYEFDQ